MARLLTDAEIEQLIAEQKVLPSNYEELIQLKPKRGHKEAELTLFGQKGSSFRLILRQSNFDLLDFSVILVFEIPQTNALFRLRRYNGKSHWHTNKLEGSTFFGYHIHKATQRYQESGLTEDGYAEQTDRYADIFRALDCLLQDCRFELPPGAQLSLPFDGGAA